MNLRRLTQRSLNYHFRAHLGVLAGATAAAAVLIGALAVGDSVRESLKEKALERLAGNSFALATSDRFFSQDLSQRLRKEDRSHDGLSLLMLSGSVTRQDSAARANQVQVIGLPPRDPQGALVGKDSESLRSGLNFTGDKIWLNTALARQLQAKVGDAVVIRIAKPSALSRDAIITTRNDASVAFRGVVGGILTGSQGGNLSLRATPDDAFNVFVSQSQLASLAGVTGRANLLLASGARPSKGDSQRFDSLPELHSALQEAWNLADVELAVTLPSLTPQQSGGEPIPNWVELNSRRIFLDPAAVQAALVSGSPAPADSKSPSPLPLLTYLVNSIRFGDRLVPYSMVTAVGSPYTPTDLGEDEVVVNEWLARDLGVKPGDTVSLTYYRADAGTQLLEQTNRFRVRSVVPLKGLHADRTLMPEFPGLAKAESTRDWDAGFDLIHTIRDQDETYWKQWRGTPKAFVSLAAGQKMWSNRFGNLTAVRWLADSKTATRPLQTSVTQRIREHLQPSSLGLLWQPIRETALRAATSGQDFGGLFIGFSFFLIVSALLLTSMLFQFGLQQRSTEVGILLALGWEPKQVRRLLFREGFALASLGTLLGAGLGALYARGILWGLSTLWRDAVAGAGIQFHLTPPTLAMGVGLSLGVAAMTLALALRHQGKRSARELLNPGSLDSLLIPGGTSRWIQWGSWICGALGVGMTSAAWVLRNRQPELFFGAGFLLLIAALLGFRQLLDFRSGVRQGRPSVGSIGALALLSLTRRPSRSVGTVALLASASFLIVGVAANRLDATRNARERGSGTGGFALWGESTLPILQDLNTKKGQDFYGLEAGPLKGVSFVGFRVRPGDEASCLNLNGAQNPRLLGVNAQELARRGAFTFTQVTPGLGTNHGWMALEEPISTSTDGVPILPAIGDANTLQWALHLGLGDSMEFRDERGQPFRVRIVGAVANSILQGSLILSESAFVQRFPSESGRRLLLMDAPGETRTLSEALTYALRDVGLELTPTVDRLDRFNSVQNTYLNTFQILGGLGLLLGSIGLGVVVLRNVFERRGELALMQAIGFESSQLRRWILTEHLLLLGAGLGIGSLTAFIAVLPAVMNPGSGVPWTSLVITLGLVGLNGLIWTFVSVHRALQARILDGLRDL